MLDTDGRLAAGVAVVGVLRCAWQLLRSAPKSSSADDKKRFTDAYVRLTADALCDSAVHPPEVAAWMRKMVDYNIPGGKNTRGLSVLQGVRCLAPSLLDDPEVHYKVCALGWCVLTHMLLSALGCNGQVMEKPTGPRRSIMIKCVEWLQGMFLVADDIMDNSITRRGKTCWYRHEGVGMIAVNDALMLDALIYRLLAKYFSGSNYYAELLDLFHEVTFDTTAGELADLLTAPIGQVDLSKYSMAKYKHIVKYKTALYSFYLPVAAAMLVAGVKQPSQYTTAREICCHIGEYFQVQDDYLDCYGDPAVIGKVGTDIEDNKCSWLVCQALLLANSKQLAILNANYGIDSPSKVKAVKELYATLRLEELYKEYEEKSYRTMQQLINEGASRQSKPIYTWLLKRIYKRVK